MNWNGRKQAWCLLCLISVVGSTDVDDFNPNTYFDEMQGGCRVSTDPTEGSRGKIGSDDRDTAVIPVEIFSDRHSTKERTAKVCGMICAYDQTCEAFEFIDAPPGHDTFVNGSCEIWIVRPNRSTMEGERTFCYMKKESGGHYTAHRRIKMQVTFVLPDNTNFTDIQFAPFRTAFHHEDLAGMHAKLCREDNEVTLVMWNDHNNGTETVQKMAQFFKPLNPPIGTAGTGKGRLFVFRDALKTALGMTETPTVKDDGKRHMSFLNNAAGCAGGNANELWDSGDPAPTDPPDEADTGGQSDADAAMMMQGIDVFVVVLCAILFSN